VVPQTGIGQSCYSVGRGRKAGCVPRHMKKVGEIPLTGPCAKSLDDPTSASLTKCTGSRPRRYKQAELSHLQLFSAMLPTLSTSPHVHVPRGYLPAIPKSAGEGIDPILSRARCIAGPWPCVAVHSTQCWVRWCKQIWGGWKPSRLCGCVGSTGPCTVRIETIETATPRRFKTTLGCTEGAIHLRGISPWESRGLNLQRLIGSSVEETRTIGMREENAEDGGPQTSTMTQATDGQTWLNWQTDPIEAASRKAVRRSWQ
jgi:hypothetical protein